jgi:hypothetical protein
MNKWATSLVTKVKQYQIYSKQAEYQRYYQSSEFTGGMTDSVTVQEMCQGKTQDLAYMDLSKISSLEDKISEMYRHLVKLHSTIKTTLVPNMINFENTAKVLVNNYVNHQ